MKKFSKFYVTTPIYYVNDVPHVGHAYTTLAADVIARYYRQILGGKNVFFLTGTDEHGANVAQAAAKNKKSPKEYADLVAPRFKEAWNLLNIRPDYFIRTTDDRHKNIAQEILQEIYDKGYIYSGIYEGWYCIGCEKFLNKSDLVKNKCPLHPTREPQYQKEKNYFLKLKELSAQVLKKIEDKDYLILPRIRHNEIVKRLRGGVEDISVSRAGVAWGINVPWDNSQTIYVWVEALLNYYTATQFVKGKKDFWPPNVQFMAKDILWFHTVIWQAILIAAGLDLPKTIFAHGFFTIDGAKMSKSLGNIISPEQLVDKYGVDGSRYLLLSAYQFGSDGDLSFAKFTEKYNADLANGLGNLVARVAKLAEKNNFKNISGGETNFYPEVKKLMEEYKFDEILAEIWQRISAVDRQINRQSPWLLKGKDLNTALNNYVSEIVQIAFNLSPFLPETSAKILKQFTTDKIAVSPSMFPRI